MTTAKVLGNFALSILARLTGNESEAIALHNEKRAASAIKKQISSLEDRKTTIEEDLEAAEEALNNAKYPTYKLGESKSEGGNNYCANIKRAQDVVDTRKQELEDVLTSIKYFEGLQKELGL